MKHLKRLTDTVEARFIAVDLRQGSGEIPLFDEEKGEKPGIRLTIEKGSNLTRAIEECEQLKSDIDRQSLLEEVKAELIEQGYDPDNLAVDTVIIDDEIPGKKVKVTTLEAEPVDKGFDFNVWSKRYDGPARILTFEEGDTLLDLMANDPQIGEKTTYTDRLYIAQILAEHTKFDDSNVKPGTRVRIGKSKNA